MSALASNGRRRTPRAAVAGVAFAVGAGLLGGCGGGSTKTATAPGTGGGGGGKSAARPTTTAAAEPQKGACGLVTQTEVEAALGTKVAAGRESTEPSRSVCSFALAGAADQSVIVISTTSSDAAAAFAAARQRAGSQAQSVTAGDQAFVAGTQGAALKGRTFVTVLLAVRQSPGALAAAGTKLLQAAAGRI